MTDKEQLYLNLCGIICSRADYDDWLLEHDPDTWQLARNIDDWLRLYVADDRVSRDQYSRNCARLLALYRTLHPQVAGGGR